jgi:tetratricopeptide (TPR) repeat protein
MDSFTRVFPLDWSTLRSALLVAGLVAVLFVLGAVLLRQARNRKESQARAVADRIAVRLAGNMMTQRRGDGDHFLLKESNSIKALITEAVLALSAQDPRVARRALDAIEAAANAPARAILADIARARRAEAEEASSLAASALRHQGALALSEDAEAALDLFHQALALDPANTPNVLAVALAHFRLGDLESLEGLRAAGGLQSEQNADELAGPIAMFGGILHFRRGQHAEAIAKFTAAKQCFEGQANPKGLADALMALASAELKAGDRTGALAYYTQAATLCAESNYELGSAQLYAELGVLLQSLGKTSDAEQMLLKSLGIADRLGETAIASTAAGNLGLLYRETRDLDRAEQMTTRALALEEGLGRKDGVARANLNLGTILFEKGRLNEAGSRFAESLRLYQELGPPERAGQAVFNLANVQRALKRNDEAEGGYRKAAELFLSVNDAAGVAGASGNLGALHLENGRLADAEEEFNIALDAARAADDKRAIAMQLRNLAVLAHGRGETAAACEGLRQSLALCAEIGAQTEALELKVLMGQIGCQ